MRPSEIVTKTTAVSCDKDDLTSNCSENAKNGGV